MKKLTAIALILTVVLSFAACNAGPKVTVYIPETVTEYRQADGEPTAVMQVLFPKNWQKKDSFTVAYSLDGKKPMEDGVTVTHADKHRRTEDSQTRLDEYFDEKGNVVSQVRLFKASAQLIQTVTTYDDHGRVLTQVTSTSFVGGSDVYTPQKTFAYQETEQGSEAAVTQSGYTETYTYDKEYRLVRYSTSILGNEQSYTEYTYDEHGNVTTVATYDAGQLSAKTVTTYKAVEVSEKLADSLPQFKRAE